MLELYLVVSLGEQTDPRPVVNREYKKTVKHGQDHRLGQETYCDPMLPLIIGDGEEKNDSTLRANEMEPAMVHHYSMNE